MKKRIKTIFFLSIQQLESENENISIFNKYFMNMINNVIIIYQ